MSYLDVPRITFSGIFKASPSTVNNAVVNYFAYTDASPFYDSDATPPSKLDAFSDPANFPKAIADQWDSGAFATGVSWNPQGLALFSFDGLIRSVTVDPRKPLVTGDPLLGAKITTAVPGQKFPAKLVDLDPDQQTVTQLYGLGVSVRLADGSGFIATISDEAMAAGKVPTLDDLWFGRIPTRGGDGGASSNLQWVFDRVTPHGTPSPLLAKFLAACSGGISIRITLDKYDDAPSHQAGQDFNGRIVGVLGPALPDEPYSFVAGRRIVARPGSMYFPVNAQVKSHVLTIDVANAVPLSNPARLDPIDEPLPMAVVVRGASGTTALTNGRNIDYSQAHYETFGGISDVMLVGGEASQVETAPLAILVGGRAVLAEDSQGRFVMPEQWALRLSPGESKIVNFWTLKFGKPASLAFSLVAPPAIAIPAPTQSGEPLDSQNVPENGLSWTIPSGPGVVPVKISAAATLPKGNLPLIRQWMGSALYVLNSPSDGVGNWQSWGQVLSQQSGLSVLVWCDGPASATIGNPTFDDIKNIMQGYAALYPAMTARVDIGSQAVLNDPASAKRIFQVMSLPLSDPGHMPVTRDLSPANRTMILNYLQRVIST
jgi:hypothetical protein